MLLVERRHDQLDSGAFPPVGRKLGLPVRSAVLKPYVGMLVVGWVITGEFVLLIVFVIFFLQFKKGPKFTHRLEKLHDWPRNFAQDHAFLVSPRVDLNCKTAKLIVTFSVLRVTHNVPNPSFDLPAILILTPAQWPFKRNTAKAVSTSGTNSPKRRGTELAPPSN